MNVDIINKINMVKRWHSKKSEQWTVKSKDNFSALTKKIAKLRKANIIPMIMKPWGSYNLVQARRDFKKYTL